MERGPGGEVSHGWDGKIMFNGVDHIAIVVRNTDEALTFYRDTLGFSVAASEVVNDPPVKLTHLDLGNVMLQLVEPMTDDHPLQEYLNTHGEGLHHICFKVDDVPAAIDSLRDSPTPPGQERPHNGPLGRKAAFLNPTHTRGLRIEITDDPDGTSAS